MFTEDNNGDIVDIRDNDIPLLSAQDFWTSLNDNSVAEPYIYDASYVKLREVRLSYRIPSSVLEKTFLNQATIGIEGRNLLLPFTPKFLI